MKASGLGQDNFIHEFTHLACIHKCGALRDLIPLVQFKKREKHPWRSVTYSKAAGFSLQLLLKVTLLHGCFSRFLNCAHNTKSRNAPQYFLKSLFS